MTTKTFTVDMSLVIRGAELTVRIEHEEPHIVTLEKGGLTWIGGILHDLPPRMRTEHAPIDVVGVWSDRLKRFVLPSGRLSDLIEDKVNTIMEGRK